jgi:NAD(P) transhydrogenase subunit alpha
VLGFVAVTAAMANVVGGFVITDRMLKMFKHDPTPPKDSSKTANAKEAPAKDAKAPGAV